MHGKMDRTGVMRYEQVHRTLMSASTQTKKHKGRLSYIYMILLSVTGDDMIMKKKKQSLKWEQVKTEERNGKGRRKWNTMTNGSSLHLPS